LSVSMPPCALRRRRTRCDKDRLTAFVLTVLVLSSPRAYTIEAFHSCTSAGWSSGHIATLRPPPRFAPNAFRIQGQTAKRKTRQSCAGVKFATCYCSINFLRRPSASIRSVLLRCGSPGSSASSSSHNLELGTDDDEEWQCGKDVHANLDRLEQAIVKTQAEERLLHRERLEELNYHARQWRPVAHEIVQNILEPLQLSTTLCILLKGLIRSRAFCLSVIQRLSTFHFWSCLVVAPLLLFLYHQQARRLDEKHTPSIPNGISEEYVRFLSDYENPRTSCRDFVLCLLEQWFSAMAGLALVGPLLHFSSISTIINPQKKHAMLLIARIATRLAAWASLHQYQELWYQLVRRDQPRPVMASNYFMTLLSNLQWTRWVTAIDLACCLASSCSWRQIGVFYGISVLTASLAVSMAHFATPDRKRLRHLFKYRPPLRIMAQAAILAWVVRNGKYLWCSVEQHLALLSLLSSRDILMHLPWNFGAIFAGFALVFAGPICHLLAWKRLIRISFTNSLSLALGTKRYRKAMLEKQKSNVIQWRYRLDWRTPERLSVILDRCYRGFWYWLFLAGTVEDKLRQQAKERARSSVKLQRDFLWQRLKRDRRRNQSSLKSRSWKRNAMNKLSRDFQSQFDSKKIDVCMMLTGVTWI
jgi:hypothetical protein